MQLRLHRRSLGQGVIVLVFVSGLYVLALHQSLPEEDARALTFSALVATNLGLVLSNRARGEPFWAGLRRPNAALWWVTGATGALLAAILVIEPARQLFRFGPLHADDVAVAITSGVLVLIFLALADRVRARPAVEEDVPAVSSPASFTGLKLSRSTEEPITAQIDLAHLKQAGLKPGPRRK